MRCETEPDEQRMRHTDVGAKNAKGNQKVISATPSRVPQTSDKAQTAETVLFTNESH